MNFSSVFTVAIRGVLLLLLSLPTIPATIIALARGNLLGIVVNASGFSLYLLALALLRWGERNEQAYEAKRVVPPAARPYKLLAAVVTALATALVAKLGAGHPIMVSSLFGLGAFLGMLLTYGLDRPKRKAPEIPAAYGIDADEVLRILEEADRRVANIARAGRKFNNPEFKTRLDRICAIARNIVLDLAEDPREIRRSRKFLSVYLDGVEKVVDGYARTHVQVHSEQLEGSFRNVLTTIEETFQEQQRKLFEHDVFDLDIQMEVLATQLKREGIL